MASQLGVLDGSDEYRFLTDSTWSRRVIAEILRSAGHVLVHAPTGFGKQSLIRALLDRHGFVVSPVESPADGPVDLVGESAAAELLLVSFRRVTRGDKSLSDAVKLGLDHFRVTAEEAVEIGDRLGVSPGASHAIQIFTGGYPGYLVACLEAAGETTVSSSEAYDLLHRGPHVTDLVERCLRDQSDDDLRILRHLAHFDRLTPTMISAVLGPEGAERITSAGLPITPAGAGWYEILEPVKSVLRDESSLDPDTAATLAPILAADVGVVAAARVLLRVHQPTAAANVLRRVEPFKLDEGSQPELLAMLRSLATTEKDDGTLHLLLARVHHNHGDLSSQRKALATASELACNQLRPDVELEAEAELLMLNLAALSFDAAEERWAELTERAASIQRPSAHIRLREVEAMLAGMEGVLTGVQTALARYKAVAREWEVAGEPARAAATLRWMIFTELVHLGRYPEGVAAAVHASKLSASQPQSLAKSECVLLRMVALSGDLENFDDRHERVLQLIDGAGLEWMEFYASLSAMWAAGFRGDASLVDHHFCRASVLIGDLADHETAVLFAAESAISYALAGDLESAERAIDSIASRADESPLEFAMAEICVRARTGSADFTELVSSVRETVAIPHERSWRIDLEEAVWRARNGQASPQEEIDAIRDEAARHGLGALFDAIARRSGLSVTAAGSVYIRLFGPFECAIDGDAVGIPSGKPSQLLKLVALQDAAIPVEVAVDQLWPEAGPGIGARRIKNVINRIRSNLGSDSLQRTDTGLALGPCVRTDLAEFRDAYRRISTEGDRCAAANRALALYRGPLLEAELYDDHVADEREACRSKALAAFQVTVADERTNPTSALEALLRIVPHYEGPYLELAKLAERKQDEGVLRESLRLAAILCDELGVTRSFEHERLIEVLEKS